MSSPDTAQVVIDLYILAAPACIWLFEVSASLTPASFDHSHQQNQRRPSISARAGMLTLSGFSHPDSGGPMAGGWSRDGAVQEQIDASVEDEIQRARSQLGKGESAEECDECGAPIPEARRRAIPGVRLCIDCQSAHEKEHSHSSGINRRGSKDSQLR